MRCACAYQYGRPSYRAFHTRTKQDGDSEEESDDDDALKANRALAEVPFGVLQVLNVPVQQRVALSVLPQQAFPPLRSLPPA
jgi:hypothetical protein